MRTTADDLLAFTPIWILLATGLLLLLYEVFAEKGDRTFCAHLAVVGLGVALFFIVRDIASPARFLFGAGGSSAPILVDDLARAGSALVVAAGIVAALLSPAYARKAGHDHGEYYALMVFAVISMMVMVMAGDLITFFVGLETMSIAVYALTGLRSDQGRSIEAALKYFLMGAFATGFLLFGITMIYGVTGSVALVDLGALLAAPGNAMVSEPLLGIGVLLVGVGFSFKVAAVPFHMWAPDVYEGAPTPVTGFMAVGVKAAAFVAMLRFVVVGFGGVDDIGEAIWIPVLRMLAILTILVGNILALTQESMKRMLAYSSVSHAGYAMIGMLAAAKGESSAGSALLFYLAAYTFTTLGAFGVLAYVERREGGGESERFGAYAGMGFKHPALGAAMTLFMVALAGLPPTGGFFGKLYVFSAAINANELVLTLVGVAGSVISVYYYLRVIVAFYMREVPEPGPTPEATPSPQLSLGLALSAAAVLILGVLPGGWASVTRAAAQSLASY